jgi:hypothetical protein
MFPGRRFSAGVFIPPNLPLEDLINARLVSS